MGDRIPQASIWTCSLALQALAISPYLFPVPLSNGPSGVRPAGKISASAARSVKDNTDEMAEVYNLPSQNLNTTCS